MATHSSILALKIPRMEKPSGATIHRVTKSWTQLSLYINIYIYKVKYIIYINNFKMSIYIYVYLYSM